MLVVPDGTDATWAKIRFGPDGWSRVAEVLPMITDEPVLVVIGNAIRDAVRDAELDPALALDLDPGRRLQRAGRPDRERRCSGSRPISSPGPYCPVADPGGCGWPGWRRRPRELVDDSRPGSDRQLAAFRMLVRGRRRGRHSAPLVSQRRGPAGARGRRRAALGDRPAARRARPRSGPGRGRPGARPEHRRPCARRPGPAPRSASRSAKADGLGPADARSGAQRVRAVRGWPRGSSIRSRTS